MVGMSAVGLLLAALFPAVGVATPLLTEFLTSGSLSIATAGVALVAGGTVTTSDGYAITFGYVSYINSGSSTGARIAPFQIDFDSTTVTHAGQVITPCTIAIFFPNSPCARSHGMFQMSISDPPPPPLPGTVQTTVDGVFSISQFGVGIYENGGRGFLSFGLPTSWLQRKRASIADLLLVAAV
jgi:hypothetical protein